MWNLVRNDTKELIHKIERDSKLNLPKGKSWGEGWTGKLGLACTHTLLYTKLVSNRDLLYSSGKSIQYSVIA